MKIPTTALYQEVAARLRERIFSQDLLPGDPIDEQALAEEFGISRTPMREALKVLHAEGLVVLEPRRGCFVTELDHQDKCRYRQYRVAARIWRRFRTRR